MKFNDDAIILSAHKYGENSGIACVLTENYGIYKGMVRNITSNKQRGIYQPGNVVEINWQARLSEHLGNFSAGLIHCTAAMIMDKAIKLSALSSMCAMIEITAQERDPVPNIYQSFKTFLQQLEVHGQYWQKSYILLELELLSQLGYGLDLSECAATGTSSDLIYVSPKSGRAVSRSAGEPYCNKLLKLPFFMIDNSHHSTPARINEGLVLCNYFLNKYFFSPYNIKEPQARIRFVAMLSKDLKTLENHAIN
jgi:DNA repair protein RecO (recombination protein O)